MPQPCPLMRVGRHPDASLLLCCSAITAAAPSYCLSLLPNLTLIYSPERTRSTSLSCDMRPCSVAQRVCAYTRSQVRLV